MPAQPPDQPSTWDQADDGTLAPPKKKRRKWPWVILTLFVLLILLVLMAPMLASTGAARSFAIGKINENLNGKLSINDWSIGWTSGITLDGVKIDDEHGVRVLEVNQIRVPASLIALAKGSYDLGDVLIDKPNIVKMEFYPDGSNNLEKLAKKGPPGSGGAAPQPAAKPSKLPDVKGKVTIRELRGTIIAPDTPQVEIEPSDIVVNIANINSPIENDIKLKYRVGQSPAGTITLAGKVDAIKENEIALSSLSADQKIDITSADLSAAAPFLKKQEITIAGVADGSLVVKIEGLKEDKSGVNDGNVEGQFTVKNFAFGGAPLKGDQYKSSLVSLPIAISTTAIGNETKIAIKTLKIETDQVLVDVSGQATQQALMNLAAQKPPGADGQLAIAVTTKDLPGLVNPLRNAIGLQKDVQINSGEFKTRVDVTLAADRAVIKQALDLHAFGVNAGKPVTLEPVHLDTALAAIPAGGAIPDLRDIAINMTSAFASAQGGGASLANLDVKGNVDLAKLRQQLAQFLDLGKLQLSGAGDFAISSKGDLTRPGATADVGAKITLTNFTVSGLGEQKDLSQPELVIDATAKIVRGEKDFVERLPTANLTFRSGTAQSPVVDLAVKATNFVIATSAVEKFDVTRLSIPDLARAQQQFGGLIDLPVIAAGGSLGGTISGSYQPEKLRFDQKLQLRNVSLNQIDATTKQPKGLIQNESQDIVVAGAIDLPRNKDDAMTAVLTALSVTSTNNLIAVSKTGASPLIVKMKGKAIGGSGELKIASDLKRLNDTLQAMGGKPAVTTSAGQLQSGLLDATVKLEATPQAGTNIQLTGGINNLSVTTNQQPIQNEKVTIALSASTPADFSGVTVSSANITSSFAKATVTGAQLMLKLPGGATPSTLEMLQSAKVEIAIPDIAKAQAVADAFSPPAAPTTMPALAIGGGAAVNLEIARDSASNTTHIKSANIGASKVSLIRGTRRFDFKQPISIQLAGDVATLGDQIQQLKLSQLGGDLGGLAKLDMPSPITVTNLTSDVPSANGRIALAGAVEPLTRLLSVIQNAEPMPYSGTYDLSQTVATQSNRLQVAGEINVNQFVVIQQGKPAFTEDKLVVQNDLVADTKTKSASINNLSLRMLSSQAAGVAVKGTISDWEVQRKLDGVTCELSYDLQKVWQILKPMLSAEQQKSYEDLKIAGISKRTFTLAGNYPANVPFEQAIKMLSADGAFSFQQFATQGIDVRDYELPITLRGGHVTTVYANKPKAERVPPPAVCNGTGRLDLGSIDVDLAAAEPLLSIGKNQQLLKDVPMNPVLADAIGKFGSFLFKDSKQASGLLNVTIVECDKVPLGELLQGQNNGRAKVNLAIKDLRLDGWMTRAIAQAAQLGNEGIVGEVRDSSITYANGQTNSDIAIYLTRKGVQLPLRFSGGIGLKNFNLRNTVLNIPPELLGSDEISRAFPQGIQLPVTGTVEQYKVADLGSIIRKNLGGVVGGVLGQITGQDKREPAATQPGQQPGQQPPPRQDNPVGDLIDIFGGKKKAEPAPTPTPDNPPPAPKKKKK